MINLFISTEIFQMFTDLLLVFSIYSKNEPREKKTTGGTMYKLLKKIILIYLYHNHFENKSLKMLHIVRFYFSNSNLCAKGLFKS